MIIEIRTIIMIPNKEAGDYSAAIESIIGAILKEFPGWKPAAAFPPISVTITRSETPFEEKEENGGKDA